MKLTWVACQGFRKFQLERFADFENLNLIWGPNGSGKSSLLEAIQLLTNGRSFRTEKAEVWVKEGEQEAYVKGGWEPQSDEVGEPPLEVRLHAVRGAPPRWWSAPPHKPCARSTLTRRFPVQWIGPEGLRLLTDGPELRRQLLDWGCFYHFPAYAAAWRQHQRALKQRNALLKLSNTKPAAELESWESMLIQAHNSLVEWRAQYLEAVMVPRWQEAFRSVVGRGQLECFYEPGWDPHHNYADLLVSQRAKERLLGYTQWGAHRADLRFEIGGRPLRQTLSRGEMKWALFLIHGVQNQALQATTGLQSLLLLDDLFAELDGDALERVHDWLSEHPMQTFMTALPSAAKLFLQLPLQTSFRSLALTAQNL